MVSTATQHPTRIDPSRRFHIVRATLWFWVGAGLCQTSSQPVVLGQSSPSDLQKNTILTMEISSEPKYEPVFSPETSAEIRQDFDRLGEVCYLDQTGCALPSKSYLEKVFKDLSSNLYSNPHSSSTVSKHTTDSIDQVRYRILQHFNTDVDEYSVIFTGGATESIKLVAESFKWSTDCDSQDGESSFVYMEDNHTSVLGMRDLVRSRGAKVTCLSHEETLDVFSGHFEPAAVNGVSVATHNTNSLFVYSAQCNFSGVRYPLSWVDKVHKGILGKRSNWYCLLDAASYVSTSKLDLSSVHPDFICVSFYKIFGYPTGLGALLVRNTSAPVLERLYYGGGTVLMALSAIPEHIPRSYLHERFEDGTINYLSIISLNHGFNIMDEVIGSYSKLNRHCFTLAQYTFNSLLRLHHANETPAVTLYVDTAYEDEETQGNIVNFNMVRANGASIGYAEVLHMANMHGIQLRTGCFCNPGACRRHLGLTTQDVRKHYEAGHVCGDDHDLVDGRPTGSVRVSFGLHNDKTDVDRLMKMLETCFVAQPSVYRWPQNWPSSARKLSRKFLPRESRSQGIERSPKPLNPSSALPHGVSNGDSNGEVPHRMMTLKIEGPEENSHLSNRESDMFLSQIFLYPVKSCGRFEVTKWELDSKGLKYDRQWMVTTDSGVALTQKTEPLLCLVRPYIDEKNNEMSLKFRGHDSIRILLNPSSDGYIKGGYSLCQSKVCGDRVRGYDCGDEVALWLSDVLKRPGLRLIRQLPDDTRINKKNSGALTLSNQSQFLFVNEASVKWLSDKLEEDSDCSKESMINRFRSNLVMSGSEEEFAERTWSSLMIGTTQFNVDGPCSRCQMICIDQDSGLKTKEPLTTLTAAFQGKMKFGIYLSRPDTSSVTISINDVITPSTD